MDIDVKGFIETEGRERWVEVDEMYNKNGIQITNYIIDDNDKFITISNKEIK